MLEEVLGHRRALLGELQVLAALDPLRDRRRRLAAAEFAEDLASAHGVADFHAQVHDLAGEGREDARHAVLVELDFARNREGAGRVALDDRIDDDRTQHRRIDEDAVVACLRVDRIRARRRVGCIRRASASGVNRDDREQDDEQNGGAIALHCATSVPTAAFSRAIARRRPACAST